MLLVKNSAVRHKRLNEVNVSTAANRLYTGLSPEAGGKQGKSSWV
jgi:hypothetical protein